MLNGRYCHQRQIVISEVVCCTNLTKLKLINPNFLRNKRELRDVIREKIWGDTPDLQISLNKDL